MAAIFAVIRDKRVLPTIRWNALRLAGRMCGACAAYSCGRAYCGAMGDGTRCACPCGTPEHGAVTR